MKYKLRTLLLLGGVSFLNLSFGQIQWEIHQLSHDIVFDGKPDEEAWGDVEPFPMVTQQPVYGEYPSQKTDIKLAYDGQNIYLGASLYVDDQDKIKAIGKVRDFNSRSCDWIGLQLDTYNDNQNAYIFFTNPNAVRWDATISNDAVAGNQDPIDLNWNTFWEVKTVIGDLVWYVEMKIPISSLRFEKKDGKTIMGFNIIRYLPSTNEIYIFPDTPYNWGDYSQTKPSTYADGIFPGMKPRKPLYISPYILTGMEYTNEINDDGTRYVNNNKFKLEPGLDIKYGINTNTTLDLTINTDFAQVEADAQQFNLSRFSLVYPEKRKFFLERASVFDFGMGGPNTLFYSRRIGLYNGDPVRILGGARLMSSNNGWDFGFLNMQTAKYTDLPSENFGVFRVKKRVLNENSYTGGMLTSRIGVNGTYNIAYGIDAVLRMFGEEYLTIRFAQSFTEKTKFNPISIDPARLYIDWTRRKNKGLSYSLIYVNSGINFDPGIGLEVFNDYYVYQAQVKHTFIPNANSKFLNHYPSLTTYTINDVKDNTLLTYLLNVGWYFTGKKGWQGSLSMEYNYEYLKEDFKITDLITIPTGGYRFKDMIITLTTPSRNSFKANSTLQAGQFYDGVRVSPQLNPTWNISNGVELGATYVLDYLNFSSRNTKLTNHILGVRGLYMLNTKFSFSGFVQYNTAIEQVISNLRLRYNPKEGTDLYLVFNGGRNTYLERQSPRLPSYFYKTFMLKYTYTFNL
ncbi:DUF5916 domain-containing protein [Saccharicrinis sp. FJH62]|uniref:carbohydrate binding family 9 domain-containing protein n=1 Tax=Saccharicrinis sp. FJH62 TaxID=3344657 RepID=UPI0035D47BB8